MKDELLWRLESFEIDSPGVAFPFSARLARENGWSHGYSRRVIREYLRFVWLAMRAGHPVTPSQAVDEAWHLHLCYTRSYWDEMCGKLLRKPLHHGPTEGGAEEDAKFGDWYGKTLASYRIYFGEPPADIWPPGEKRFAPVRERKVDVAAHWIVPKKAALRCFGGAAALASLPVLASCTPLAASIDSGSMVVLGLFFFAFLVLAKIFSALGITRGKGGRKVRRHGSGCGSFFSGCSSSGSHHHSDGDGGSGSDSSGCSSSGCGGGGCGGGGGGD